MTPLGTTGLFDPFDGDPAAAERHGAAFRAAAYAACAAEGEALAESHPHLFSGTPFVVGAEVPGRLQAVIDAAESAAALPGFRSAAAAFVPQWAQSPVPQSSVFYGYDFHLTDAGPRLIEINTNAGGGFLLERAIAAQHRVPLPAPGLRPQADPETLRARILDMFEDEWTAARGAAPLQRVALVDDAPDSQFLAPEFRLCARWLRTRGWEAVIADAAELSMEAGKLATGGRPVGLVYNRTTDFYLDDPAHAALRQAAATAAAVVTPHPHGYGRIADKRHLMALCDAGRLRGWGLDAAAAACLAECVPQTVPVGPEDAARLWAERKQWFFKPATGYGSKAAYRGDKLTRGVWEQVTAGGYLAQRLAPPPELPAPGGALRADLRAYVYQGRIQCLGARLYRGQTTNFRTPGGGFAPVYVRAP